MSLNLTKTLFLNTMLIGVMISVSSNNWINMWAGMEIGVLSLIPMLTQEKTSSDSPIKYFIIQSISSSLMIMSVMMMSSEINFKMLILISMMIKIGAAPFHIWILVMIEDMSYLTIMMLFTIIKIPAMMVLSTLNEQINMWSLMSMSIGAIMGMNQTSIKKILSYSSIYNLGIMMSVINENQIWLNYMMIYSITLIMVLNLMSTLKIKYMNQTMMNEIEPLTKMSLWISLMSMAGLPPMVGFITKMTVLEMLMSKGEVLTSFILILSSMIMMFIYMRISFMSMMISSTSAKWSIFKKSKNSIKILMLNMTLTPIMLSLKSLT